MQLGALQRLAAACVSAHAEQTASHPVVCGSSHPPSVCSSDELQADAAERFLEWVHNIAAHNALNMIQRDKLVLVERSCGSAQQ